MRDQSATFAAWYERNREQKTAYQRDRNRSTRERVDRVKLERGCDKCGYDRCSRALQFHHANDDKEHAVSKLAGRGRRWDLILAEMEKCELLCANCHAEHHAGLVEADNTPGLHPGE